jgi:thiamine biosynthesis lipoprotein
VIEQVSAREFRFSALVIGFILFATLVACSRSRERASDAAHLIERSRPSMGAEAHLSAWTSDEAAAIAAFEEIFTELERLEWLMSVWRQGSDIVRLNDAAGSAPVAVSAEVMDALRTARRSATGPGADSTSPSAPSQTSGNSTTIRTIAYRRPKRFGRASRWLTRAVVLDAGARTAYLPRKGMRAHLGGIGKGLPLIVRRASCAREAFTPS